MANINYSTIFPVSTSGSSTIAGMTSAGIKSTDFTATANSIYEIIASCKMTLPSSPSTNDRVAFILTSTANFDITSTDKINGSVLATDYVKRVTTTYLWFVWTYSGSTNGWIWDSAYTASISTAYTGSGLVLPYTNSTTYDGLFNYLGTSQLTTSWSNPSPSKITITNVSNSPIDSGSFSNIVDKTTTTTMLFGFFNISSSTFKILFLNNITISISRVLLVTRNDDDTMTVTVKGIKADNTTETLFTVTSVYGSGDVLNNQVVSSLTVFKGLEISHSRYRLSYKELEIWGTVLF